MAPYKTLHLIQCTLLYYIWATCPFLLFIQESVVCTALLDVNRFDPKCQKMYTTQLKIRTAITPECEQSLNINISYNSIHQVTHSSLFRLIFMIHCCKRRQAINVLLSLLICIVNGLVQTQHQRYSLLRSPTNFLNNAATDIKYRI